MKTRKIWIGIGAFVVAGTGAQDALKAEAPSKPALMRDALQKESARSIMLLAEAAKPEGEGGEGGEGGEAGIDPEAADKDAVKYGIALQVIAAHFHAGLYAYDAAEQEAAAQMFAHGHTEVYSVMEPVFQKRGIMDLGEKMEKVIDAAVSKVDRGLIRGLVRNVLSGLDEAAKAGPASPLSAPAVQAQIAADMLDRAAAQYGVILKDSNLETYLDGLGFALAARTLADGFLPALRKNDAKAAAAFDHALKFAAAAYPDIKRPAKPPFQPGEFLAAASAAKIAANGIK